MTALELAITLMKRAGYQVEPNAGKFDVVRLGSRLRLTKDELVRFGMDLEAEEHRQG